MGYLKVGTLVEIQSENTNGLRGVVSYRDGENYHVTVTDYDGYTYEVHCYLPELKILEEK